MRVSALAILASFLSAATVAAAPVWKAELTSPEKGKHPELPPIALDFRLSWKGMIQSGALRMEFAPPDAAKAGAYVVRSSAISSGLAAKLYPYQSQFWSELDRQSLRPRFFHASESDSEEESVTTVRHFARRVESREKTLNHKTRHSETSDGTFRFAPVFDIFSAMLHVRSQRLAAGDRIAIVIHPFDNPYLLRVQCHGSGIHHGRKAIRLSVGMQKIDRETFQLRPYKKLKRDATLWISDDADRIPIEFRAAVFIGDVRATLVKSARL